MNSFKQMIKAGVIKRTDTGMFIRHADIHVKPGFNRRVEDERSPVGLDAPALHPKTGHLWPEHPKSPSALPPARRSPQRSNRAPLAVPHAWPMTTTRRSRQWPSSTPSSKRLSKSTS